MYEWQNMDFNEAGSLVFERDPREFGWGYLVNDNVPQGGATLYCWFESPQELLDFLVNIEVEICSGSEKRKKDMQEVAKKADISKGHTNTLLEQINKIFERGEIIEGIQNFGGTIYWWGKFSDLCSGTDDFSRELINDFYEDFEGYSEDNRPQKVTDDDLPKFVEMLQGPQ